METESIYGSNNIMWKASKLHHSAQSNWDTSPLPALPSVIHMHDSYGCFSASQFRYGAITGFCKMSTGTSPIYLGIKKWKHAWTWHCSHINRSAACRVIMHFFPRTCASESTHQHASTQSSTGCCWFCPHVQQSCRTCKEVAQDLIKYWYLVNKLNLLHPCMKSQAWPYGLRVSNTQAAAKLPVLWMHVTGMLLLRYISASPHWTAYLLCWTFVVAQKIMDWDHEFTCIELLFFCIMAKFDRNPKDMINLLFPISTYFSYILNKWRWVIGRIWLTFYVQDKTKKERKEK